MNRITLMRDGSILQDGKPVTFEPLICLSSGVDLDEGYTLRSWFQMFEEYSVLTDLNPFLPTLMEEYSSCPKSGCLFDGVDHFEFRKVVEMIGFPGEPRLEIYNSFKGLKNHDELDSRSVRMEYTLDMPVLLGKLKHVVFGDKADIFEFETVYSLFEFIDGIAWELSFFGAPTQCEIGR
jgi:hypothetical protein